KRLRGDEGPVSKPDQRPEALSRDKGRTRKRIPRLANCSTATPNSSTAALVAVAGIFLPAADFTITELRRPACDAARPAYWVSIAVAGSEVPLHPRVQAKARERLFPTFGPRRSGTAPDDSMEGRPQRAWEGTLQRTLYCRGLPL